MLSCFIDHLPTSPCSLWLPSSNHRFCFGHLFTSITLRICTVQENRYLSLVHRREEQFYTINTYSWFDLHEAGGTWPCKFTSLLFQLCREMEMLADGLWFLKVLFILLLLLFLLSSDYLCSSQIRPVISNSKQPKQSISESPHCDTWMQLLCRHQTSFAFQQFCDRVAERPTHHKWRSKFRAPSMVWITNCHCSWWRVTRGANALVTVVLEYDPTSWCSSAAWCVSRARRLRSSSLRVVLVKSSYTFRPKWAESGDILNRFWWRRISSASEIYCSFKSVQAAPRVGNASSYFRSGPHRHTSLCNRSIS